MTLLETEKLTNFCNNIIVRNNPETRGVMAYFEYKDKQYYASLCFIQNVGAEVGIFAACDDYVTSWDYLYRNYPDEVSIKNLRFHIFKFLESLHPIKHNPHKIHK